MTTRFFPLGILVLLTITTACEGRRARAMADSLQAVRLEQLDLANRLSAQKDSLTSIIVDADAFIMQIDSQIRTVKGLPAGKRPLQPMESPLEEQLQARKEMLARVDALVKRTRATAVQLAESRRREQELRGENMKLQEQIDSDQKIIASLNETIQRHVAEIAELQVRVDSLVTETRTVGSAHYRAYYVVGTERELLERGIIAREGGANLLIARVGRTLQPARRLDRALFTAIDQREVREIQVPDSTRRYRLVSRQSLDGAEVLERDNTTFRGHLRITDIAQFWAQSRFLILVAM